MRFVRLLWCDAGGVRRCRVVPYAASTIGNGIGLTQGCMAMAAHGDSCVPESGLGPIGEVILLPDLDTLKVLPWHPNHGIVLADMHVVVDPDRSLDTAWEACPRSALKRAILHAASRGLHLHVGFELEFLLMRRAPDGSALTPVDNSVYCQSSSLDAMATVLDDIVTTLQQLGIGVRQFHAESANGQFEIALQSYKDPLAAADKLLLAREAVAAVASRHELVAVFHPKPLGGQAGNGSHCHFNLMDRDGRNVMLAGEGQEGGKAGLRAEAEAFLAGVLHHLPALLPWMAPSKFSYRRLAPGCWAGAYCCWGVDNREAALRLTGLPPQPPPSPRPTPTPTLADALALGSAPTTFDGSSEWQSVLRLQPAGGPTAAAARALQRAAAQAAARAECKALDGSCNPHLALAAMIVAGVAGVEAGMQLPAAVQVDPHTLGDKGRQEAGIQRLPASLEEAVTAAEENKDLMEAMRSVLGEQLVTAFLAVRQATADHNLAIPLDRY